MTDAVMLTPTDLEAINYVDKVINQAIPTGDPRQIWTYGRNLSKGVVVNSFSLCKLLSHTRDRWETFRCGGTDDDFYDTVHAELGIAIETAKKYIRMWNNIFENPQITAEVKNNLLGRNIRTVLLLTGFAGDTVPKNAEETEEFWNEITQTCNEREVRDVVRKHRGEVTSSSTRIILYYDHKSGNLWATDTDGRRHMVALVYTQDSAYQKTEYDDVVDNAIQRILHSAGIIEV
jgi:hypothetical protein